jgi:hypothetical protein
VLSIRFAAKVTWGMRSLGFFIALILPGADSASNRNDYQGYFLRVKAAGAWD